MKTVTDDFVREQLKPLNHPVRRVYTKRRYWDMGDAEYKWEGSWTEFSLGQIMSISPVNWQLDAVEPNEFKVSNVTLNFKNEFNQWSKDNPSSFFAQDEDSPIYGYEPYWTMFQIRAGYQFSDGTEELVVLFTGVLTELSMDSQTKIAQVSIQGLEAILLNGDAEEIGTEVDNENLGTANGVNPDFYTDFDGVGLVKLVSDNGITQIEGQHYTVSDLNDKDNPAKITFTVPPLNAHVIRAYYFYWPQDVEFSTLVTNLLTAAGIDPANQEVSPVIFPNTILGSRVFNTQPHWQEGSGTGYDTTSRPGRLKINFADNSQAEDVNWSESVTGWGQILWHLSTGWTSDGAYLISETTPPSGPNFPYIQTIYRSLPKRSMGKWSCKFSFPEDGDYEEFGVIFLGNGIRANSPTWNLLSGPSVRIKRGPFHTITLYDKNNTIVKQVATDNFDDEVERTLSIVRTGKARVMIYIDSTLMIDVIDTFREQPSYFGFSYKSEAGSVQGSVKIRDIHVAAAAPGFIWESPAINTGGAVLAWGKLIRKQALDGSEIFLHTKTSSDGITWNSYTALPSNDVPRSALLQYIKVRITLQVKVSDWGGWFSGPSSDDGLQDPEIISLTVPYTTSSIQVELPNFVGKTCYDAIVSLAKFANYEFGSKPDGVFFFRPRPSGVDSSISVNESNFILGITNMTLGQENVYGKVRVVYGDYTKDMELPSDYPSSPTARFSNRRYELSADSAIIINPNNDVATGVAKELFSRLSIPRKQLKLKTKILPQTDIEDVIQVTLENNTPPRPWYMGDDTINLGDDVYLWGDSTQFLSEFMGKVVGAQYDLENFTSEFDIEEVRS